MALPVNRPLQEIALSAHLKDVTTSGAELCATYIPAPFRGSLERVYAVIYATATGTASVVTTAVGGTAVAGCTLTLATVSGVAGQVFSGTPTARTAVNFSEGDIISFTSDGAGADLTVPVNFTAVLKRV